MKTAACSEADGGYAHVKCQPQVYHPDIDIELSPMDEKVAKNVDKSGGDAEIY